MEVKAITPVVVVDEIESIVSFWTKRLGFQNLAEVPHEDKLGFIMFGHGSSVVMFQTRDSVLADIAEAAPDLPNPTNLFIEVESLDAVKKRLGDYPRFMDERETFYGMKEIGVFDPKGNPVVFAERIATAG